MGGPGLEDARWQRWLADTNHIVPMARAGGDLVGSFGQHPKLECGAQRRRRRAVQLGDRRNPVIAKPVDPEAGGAVQLAEIGLELLERIVARFGGGDAKAGDLVGRGRIDRNQHRGDDPLVADRHRRLPRIGRGDRFDPCRRPALRLELIDIGLELRLRHRLAEGGGEKVGIIAAAVQQREELIEPGFCRRGERRRGRRRGLGHCRRRQQ